VMEGAALRTLDLAAELYSEGPGLLLPGLPPAAPVKRPLVPNTTRALRGRVLSTQDDG